MGRQTSRKSGHFIRAWRCGACAVVGVHRTASLLMTAPSQRLTFSGMGDSAKRGEYSNAHRVAEMAAVIEDGRLGLKPLVVGHSFGGTNMTMSFGGAITAPIFPAPSSSICSSAHRAKMTAVRVVPAGQSLTSRTKQPSRGAIGCRALSALRQRNSSSSTTAQHSLWSRRNGGWTSGSMTTAFAAAVLRDEPLADYLRDMALPKGVVSLRRRKRAADRRSIVRSQRSVSATATISSPFPASRGII